MVRNGVGVMFRITCLTGILRCHRNSFFWGRIETVWNVRKKLTTVELLCNELIQQLL